MPPFRALLPKLAHLEIWLLNLKAFIILFLLLHSIKRLNSQHCQSLTKGLPRTVEQQEPGHSCGGVRGGLHLQHLEGLAGGVAEDEEVLDQVVGLMIIV
mgnify:CR=1 FL=1